MKRYLVLLSVFYHGGDGHERPMYYCISARTQQAAANKVVKMAKKELYRTSVTVLNVEELNEGNERALWAASADKSKHIEGLKRLIETAQKELAAEEKMLNNLHSITRAINRYDNYGKKEF